MNVSGVQEKDGDGATSEESAPKLSSAEYVAASGAQCPNCLSTDLDGGPFDLNSGDVSQDINCNACGARWVDCYTLTGYEVYEGPDE